MADRNPFYCYLLTLKQNTTKTYVHVFKKQKTYDTYPRTLADRLYSEIS